MSAGLWIMIISTVLFFVAHLVWGQRISKILIAPLIAVYIFGGIILPLVIRGTFKGAVNNDRAIAEGNATYQASHPTPAVNFAGARDSVVKFFGGGSPGTPEPETWSYDQGQEQGQGVPVTPSVEWFLREDALQILVSKWGRFPGDRQAEPSLIGLDNIPSDVEIFLRLTNGRGHTNAVEVWEIILTHVPSGRQFPTTCNGWFARQGFDASPADVGTRLIGIGTWELACGKDCFYAVEIAPPPPTATPIPTPVGAATYPFLFPQGCFVISLPQGEKSIGGCQSPLLYIECVGGQVQWGNETAVRPGETCRAP